MSKSLLFTGAVVAAVVLTGVKVYADDAGDIYTDTYNQPAVYDNEYGVGNDVNSEYPVITAILSQPGSVGGKNYTGWAILAADQTGSLDIFATGNTLNHVGQGGYGLSGSATPAVGDAISANGSYQPYHALPEMNFSTVVSSNNYITLQSRGNPTTLFSPLVLTINELNTVAGASNVNVAGFYIELEGVQFSGGGVYSGSFPTPIQGNVSYTITDGTGAVQDYDYVTQYSTAGSLGGSAIPGGPVNVYGFMSVYPSSALPGGGLPEFTVTQIVPEPSAFVLAGMGLLGLLAIRRRRS